MEEKNETRIERQGDISVLHIQGDITAHSETHINDAYNELTAQGPSQKILIHFEQDAYINSGGIAVLIQILAKTQKNNQKVGIAGLSEHFQKIFRMVGITKFANIYADLGNALQSFS